MMKYLLTIAMWMAVLGVRNAWAADSEELANSIGMQYGYIGLCAAILIIAAIVLAKKPARKLNE